jgi:hypothetical protein
MTTVYCGFCDIDIHTETEAYQHVAYHERRIAQLQQIIANWVDTPASRQSLSIHQERLADLELADDIFQEQAGLSFIPQN